MIYLVPTENGTNRPLLSEACIVMDDEIVNKRAYCPFHDSTDRDVWITDTGFQCHGATCNKKGIAVSEEEYDNMLTKEQQFLMNQSNGNQEPVVIDWGGGDDDWFDNDEPTPDPIPVPAKAPAPEIDWNNIIRQHVYRDIDGNNIKRTIYYGYKNSPGKTPRQQRWDNNKWEYGLTFADGSKVQNILYNSHLFKNGYTQKIMITEGEKDADTIITVKNRLATTLGGAKNIITGIHKKYLINRQLIAVVGDNDQAGAEFIYKTISSLINMAYPVENIRCLLFTTPDDYEGKGYDISDAIEADGEIEILDIFNKKVENHLKKYEIFIDDLISTNYLLKGHQSYPKNIFRTEVEEMLESVAMATATTYSNTAHSFLPIVSYLVCDKYHFQEGTFQCYLTIHCVLVSVSGGAKSNAQKFFFIKIEQLNTEKKTSYIQATTDYKGQLSEWKTAKAAAAKSKTTFNMEKPVIPLRSIATLTNMTIPSLTNQFTIDNKLMIYKDEIAGLMKGLNQFSGGKGNEKDELMGMIDNTRITATRKNTDGTTKIIDVERPLLPIYGSIQWSRIGVMTDGKESGFPYRFLFCTNEKHPYKVLSRDEKHIIEKARDLYSQIFDSLKNIKEDSFNCTGNTTWEDATVDGNLNPSKLLMDDEAFDRWKTFIENRFELLSNAFEKEGKDILPMLAKMRPHFNKFIGLIHILDHYDDAEKIDLPITIDVIERAERLTMFYMAQAYKVFHEREIKDNKNEDSNFIKIKNFMKAKELAEVSLSVLGQYVLQREYKQGQVAAVRKIVEDLERRGYLKITTSKSGKANKVKLV